MHVGANHVEHDDAEVFVRQCCEVADGTRVAFERYRAAHSERPDGNIAICFGSAGTKSQNEGE
jgi:hypothetical protein